MDDNISMRLSQLPENNYVETQETDCIQLVGETYIEMFEKIDRES